jgi:putative addiction module component (TIGR02574 family)
MTKKAEALLRDALDLDQRERTEMAAALLESVEPQVDPREIEQAWREAVRQRVAEIESGRAELIPWEQVRDQLMARLNERP